MPDYDAVIIGSGPAGLTAGLYLCRAKRRTILLEKAVIGGPIMDLELIENYPGFPDGVCGAQLGSDMLTQATNYGLEYTLADVTGIELQGKQKSVKCADGPEYSTKVVIITGGAHHRKLGVPGEEEFTGKGVFYCAFCDGNRFADQVVVVCGSGDAGITEGLYMANIASKVIMVEALPYVTASAILKERASANPKLEIHCGIKVEGIIGNDQVEAVKLVDVKTGAKETLGASGILVHVGIVPNTGYLKSILPLDAHGQIVVNDKMETGVPGIFAAGDIRNGILKQITSAVGDGAIAAISAERFLKEFD